MARTNDEMKAPDHEDPTHQEHSPDDFDATPEAANFSYGERPEREEGVREFAAVRQFTAVAEGMEARPVAMLVCHGMGQQVRFETVGQIASSILTAARNAGCRIDPNGVHLCQQDKGFLARAELKWSTPEGVSKEAHIYEAYWAPVTEGKVTYRDTLAFLFEAAWRGIRSSRFLRKGIFRRWIFGGLREMSISAWTQVALVLVALALALEVGVIGFVTLKVAAGVKEVSSAVWPTMPHLHELSLRSLGLFLWRCFLELAKPFVPEHAALHHWPPDRAWWGAVARTLVWFLMIGQAFFVRYFLIEYVGDVAAYISPYKDSKFDAIRTQIQEIGLSVGRVIYGFDRVPGVPEYERVIVAGHSLGTVLAYDTLNALINTDLTSEPANRQDVVGRTSHLITFGSPLDKTAFLFRTQSNHVKDPLREQMAAGFQPLVLNYVDYRSRLEWINLWSPMDIISGSLDYYDFAGARGYRPVVNQIDPGAWIPFAAHVQYWNGEKLATTLLGAI